MRARKISCAFCVHVPFVLMCVFAYIVETCVCAVFDCVRVCACENHMARQQAVCLCCVCVFARTCIYIHTHTYIHTHIKQTRVYRPERTQRAAGTKRPARCTGTSGRSGKKTDNMCVYIFIYICVCVCVYMYMYICICM